MKHFNLKTLSLLFIMLSVLVTAAPSYAGRHHDGHRWHHHRHHSYHSYHSYGYRPYYRGYYNRGYVRPYYSPYAVYPPYYYAPGVSFYFSF